MATALGRPGMVRRVDRLQATGGAIVLRLMLSDRRRLMLKVASGDLMDF